MPRRKTYTKSELQHIRASQLGNCTKALNRVGKFAAGELKGKNGEVIQLTANELKAAQIIRDTVLPAQQSQEITDMTPDRDIKQSETRLEELRKQLIASMTPEEISQVMADKAKQEKDTTEARTDN